MDGEMARGQRRKVQVEDCMWQTRSKGFIIKGLGALKKPAEGLARMMVGVSSKYQMVITAGQALPLSGPHLPQLHLEPHSDTQLCYMNYPSTRRELLKEWLLMAWDWSTFLACNLIQSAISFSCGFNGSPQTLRNHYISLVMNNVRSIIFNLLLCQIKSWKFWAVIFKPETVVKNI